MQIAVIGAGAIGSLVAGYLKNKGQKVCLTGHGQAVGAISKNGLNIRGVRGDLNIPLDVSERLSSAPELVILATKTQDIEDSLKENLEFIKNVVVLTTQNGIEADDIVSKYLPKEKIISSIVMFGATYLEPGKVVHNFEGDWILGSLWEKNNASITQISPILETAFSIKLSQDIRGMKYLKIFLNANNCLPAILGLSMQQAFSDIAVSRIAMAIWKEGLDILSSCAIHPVSLPDFPLERLTKLASLPVNQAAEIYSGMIAGLSKEPLYGSVLQSIKRGRPSEIDYLNGEFVRLAETKGLAAPLNEKLVQMVHRVEKTGKFLAKEELLKETEGLIG